MTFAPPSILDLAAFWEDMGGVSLGIVGNQRHCVGYHLGLDRIYGECACKPDGTCEPGLKSSDYSVQYARDKEGLSNAASAIDLGRLDGSLAELRAFSRWLVAQCQSGRDAYQDIREVIYSPDGVKVQRYSGVDNGIHTGAGNGDTSHLSHTHISFFRDSEARDKRPMFAGYFVPDTSTGETMSIYVRFETPGTFVIPAGRAIPAYRAGTNGWEVAKTRPAAAAASDPVPFVARLGRLSGTTRPSSLLLVADAHDYLGGLYVSTADVTETYAPPAPDTSPYTAADLAAAITADRAKARVTWE